MSLVPRAEEMPRSALYADFFAAPDSAVYHYRVPNPDASGLHTVDNHALRVPVAPTRIAERLAYWGVALPLPGLLKFDSRLWDAAPRVCEASIPAIRSYSARMSLSDASASVARTRNGSAEALAESGSNLPFPTVTNPRVSKYIWSTLPSHSSMSATNPSTDG